MVLKFPSGRVSVSLQDLRANLQSPSSCGICDKPWVICSDGCIMKYLHILHPCQHLVGEGCWSSVPKAHKGKCPVCKVEILCDEKVRIQTASVHANPASQESPNQEPDGNDDNNNNDNEKKIAPEERLLDSHAQKLLVQKKMKDGLNAADVRAIMYYMNLRARFDAVKGSLATFLASTKALTPAHRERMVLFLANAPRTDHDTSQRKIDVALSAFNIRAGTHFSVNHLKTALAGAEKWVRKHFLAILDAGTDKDAADVRELEKKIRDARAELRLLKERQERENRRRLEGEIELAAEGIDKVAVGQVSEVRAEAERAVARILAEAEGEVGRIRARAAEDGDKLRSQGAVVNK